MKRDWKRVILPGLVFQSVLVGGGYGTGAEIGRYFGRQGLWGGLLGLGVTALVWGVLCGLSFDFARVFRAWDYGSMLTLLLGPWALFYDLCYAAMTLIVLGVVNATAVQITGSVWGAAAVSCGTILLVLWGTEAVEKAFSVWSYVLYGVYLLFLLTVFLRFGDGISAEFARREIGTGWLPSGLQYAGYNLVCIPIVLYTVRDAASRQDCLLRGALAGLLGTAPALLLLLAMACDLRCAVGQTSPVGYLFDLLNLPWLALLFQIVLFGTLIETGAGFVKAAADRFSVTGGQYRTVRRAVITVLVTIAGMAASSLGLTGLVSRGYGTVCWGFLLLYALPMLVRGRRMLNRRRH